jgi:hypothetical protein
MLPYYKRLRYIDRKPERNETICIAALITENYTSSKYSACDTIRQGITDKNLSESINEIVGIYTLS